MPTHGVSKFLVRNACGCQRVLNASLARAKRIDCVNGATLESMATSVWGRAVETVAGVDRRAAGARREPGVRNSLARPSVPKLDLTSIPERKGSSYPAPFDQEVAHRIRQRLGEAGGLTQFGVNLLHLLPGAWSSQRHWHALEDEFVYVITGEIVL